MSISDRILLMRAGELQQYSTPQEMYRQPANHFVAGFLGNPPINFLPCVCEGDCVMVPGIPEWNIFDVCVCGETISGAAVLGIRPEDLTIAPDGPIQATVTTMQTLGKEVYLKLEAGGYELTACLSWDHDFRVGETLRFEARKLYLFSPECGEGGSHEAC